MRGDIEPSSPGLDAGRGVEHATLQAKSQRRNATHFFLSLMCGFFCKRETAHEVRGTSALRGPERSGDIEPSSPGLDSKKAAIPFGITAFSRARDGDRTRDPLLGKEVLHR